MNGMVPALQLNNDRVVETGAPAVAAGENGTQTPLLVEYWRTIDRWKWVVVAIVTAALILGLAFTLLATPEYTATGRLQIDREEMRVTNVESLTPETAGRDAEFYETQYSLLRARSLADRVARDLRLASDQEFLTTFQIGSGENEGRSQIVSASERAELHDEIVGVLLDNVTISPIRDSRLVDVSFSSPSPGLSARITNAWMRSFAAASVDRRFDSTADARRFLEDRLQELRIRLQNSERQFVNYARANDIVALTTTTDQEGRTRAERTLVGDSLAALNTELTGATADRIAAQSALGTSQNDEGSATYNQTLFSLRQERAEVAAEYARLLVQFEPEYPTARQLKGQIDALDASIVQEENRVRSQLAEAYESAARREANLRGRVEQLQGELARQQSASIRYNILQREVDTNRQLYDALLQRYKEIGVAGVGVSNISIVDNAEIPDSPSSPRLVINLLGALLLGIALSGAAVYVLEQSDEGLKEPSQVVSRLNVPLLGSVPKIDDFPQEQITDPKSDYFEAFVSIRTSLQFSTDHGIPKSLFISSTRPAEGKSTSSMALAVVIARMGRKVVLIDSDMRSPSIAALLDIPEKGGLSNYLSGSDDIQSFIRDTQFENLKAITTGPTPPSATDLLAGDRLAKLVQKLLGEFDHVIIDAPPVLAMADVPLIAQSAEGCIFVIQSEETAVRGITNAINRIRAAGMPIIGAILTKINVRTAGYGYGYGTRYGYGYGYGYGESATRSEPSRPAGEA